MEMLRCDDPMFEKFGQVYITTCYPGVVNEFFIGEDNPMLIHIPEMVLHGFKAYGSEPAYVVNTVTQPYNHKQPDEFRIDPFDNDIPYDWELKQG